MDSQANPVYRSGDRNFQCRYYDVCKKTAQQNADTVNMDERIIRCTCWPPIRSFRVACLHELPQRYYGSQWLVLEDMETLNHSGHSIAETCSAR